MLPDETGDLRVRLDQQIAARRAAKAAPRRVASSNPLARADAVGEGLRLIAMLLAAALIALLLRLFILQPYWIPSESMEPTLHGCAGCNDDRLLVNKLAYVLNGVHRGDVVVFHRPPSVHTAEKDLVKRVVALPGETVSAHGGKVWVGDRPVSEPYVSRPCHGTDDFGPVTVPRGELFVMGDNRCDSFDSRMFGPIPRSSIIGRAFVIMWPISRVHWL